MQAPQATGFSFSSIAIRRHIGTLVLTLAVIILGLFFMAQLPVDLLPSITYPRIGVRINAPGVSPEVAVEEVTKPLEEAFLATEGLQQIYSQTREGQVSLNLYFQPGGNIDRALNDATAAFNRSRGRLPDTIEEPRIFKFDPSQLPVYEFALTSTSLQGVDLRVFADKELVRELGLVSGVAGVNVSGGVQEEVRVNIDLERLQAMGVGLPNVLGELTSRNQDTSGGRLRGGQTEALSRTVGKFSDAREIRDLSFEVSGTELPRRVYLRDFAEVIDGTEEQRVFVSLNQEPAVKVSIQKQPDANTIQVVDGVKQRLSALQKSGLVPADMNLIPTLDESRFIRNSLADVTSAALSGAALAAISVFVFLGSLRQTLIISLTIPLCTLAAAIAMKLCGFSLNVFSLGGLAISVGQAVDTSVVILENISKRSADMPITPRTRSQRNPYIELVESSSREVESSLVASTAANLVSVIPFLLVGGFVSLLFNELILTICFAVAASLLVAVTVVPMLSSQLLAIPWSSRLDQFWLLRGFNYRFERATQGYGQFLASVLRFRWLVVAIAVVVLGGSSLLMLGQIPQEILPRISTGQANLSAQFPPGTTLETNRKVMEMVEGIFLKQPETEYAFTTIGGSLFGTNTTENPLRGSSSLTLKSGTDVPTFVKKVNQELDRLNLAGIRLRLTPGSVRGLILSNSPINAEVDVILQGEDASMLRRAGRQVLRALDENVTTASFRPDADDPQPEVQIRPDWERANALGLTAQEIGATIQTAIQGSVPTQLQRGDRLVDIRVQLAQGSVQRASQLGEIPLFVQNSRPIRLSDVAQIEEGQAPGEIQRIDQRQVFLIAGSLEKGARLSDAIAQTNAVLADLDLPDGVTILPSSAQESNQQLQNSLALLGGLASFLVFVVMAVQYNSLIDPLVIMLTVPLALAGGIFGLYVTQTAIGATVIVGAVLLVGIVVNNAIIMIELANQIRESEECDRRTAILKAAPQRLRPILMTTVTTVLGLFPLALGIGEGSEFLQPLGVVVFSGLSLATLLTLLIIPCLYLLLHELPWNVRKKTRQLN